MQVGLASPPPEALAGISASMQLVNWLGWKVQASLPCQVRQQADWKTGHSTDC